MKICVAIGHSSFEECAALLAQESLCELRLDLLSLDSRLPELFSGKRGEVIVTYRSKPDETPAETDHRIKTLSLAMELGSTYVDIDIAASESERTKLVERAKKSGTKIIISYHNFDRTLPLAELRSISDQCFGYSANTVKIATRVSSAADNITLLSLLSDTRPLVVVGMGELGKLIRVVAPLLGSQFTYAAPENNSGTAPGQLSVTEMRALQKVLTEFNLAATDSK